MLLRENRDLTAEERSQYDQMNADLDAGAETIRSIEESEQRNAEAAEALQRIGGPTASRAP